MATSSRHELLYQRLNKLGLNSQPISAEQLQKIWPALIENLEENYQTDSQELTLLEKKLDQLQKEHQGLMDKVESLETENSRKSKALDYHMRYDSLTDFYNRNEFYRQLKNIIEVGSDEYCLLLLNINHFRLVNDNCGYEAGDELIRQVSIILKSQLLKDGIFGRLGADEFAILIRESSVNRIQRVANKLYDAIEDYIFIWLEQTFNISIRIGIVLISKGIQNQDFVLNRAVRACQKSRDKGNRKIHVFSKDEDDLSEQSREINCLNEIYAALEDERLILFGQIIESSKGAGEVVQHFEVLLRLRDKKGNFLAPGVFLKVAERYNLMPTLDRWVIKNTCKLLEKHPERMNELMLCTINISGQSINDDSFVDFILDIVSKHNIAPEKICFEITETVAIENMGKATKFISYLQNLGFQFALDDFGSGMSSFGYLKFLPVDYVKIDGMFVKDIVQDPIDLAMVKSINEIAHVMGKKTIAEFVENEEIKQKIIELNVDYVQGYGISEPRFLLELFH